MITSARNNPKNTKPKANAKAKTNTKNSQNSMITMLVSALNSGIFSLLSVNKIMSNISNISNASNTKTNTKNSQHSMIMMLVNALNTGIFSLFGKKFNHQFTLLPLLSPPFLAATLLGITTFTLTHAPAAQAQTAQAITGFAPATPKVYAASGAASTFALTASGGASNNPIVFASTTPTVCTVVAQTATIVAAGTCTLTADQAGSVGPPAYAAAPQITKNVIITKANQTITFATLAAKSLNSLPFTITATPGASSSPVIFAIVPATPPTCSLSTAAPWTITLSNPAILGTCTLTANQAGDANYNAAPQITRSFAITKNSQAITFAAITAKTIAAYGIAGTPATAPVAFTATALSSVSALSSTIAITSTTPTICTATPTTAPAPTGSDITLLSIGTCTLVANQAGDAQTNAAPQVTRSFAVNKITQTITFATITAKAIIPYTPPITASNPPSAFTAPVSSSNASTNPAQMLNVASTTPSVCTVAAVTTPTTPPAPVTGVNITLLSIGTCTITADQAGDTAFYTAATQVSRSFTINKAAQTITFSPIANQIANAAPFGITGKASSSSGLAIAYASTTPTICTVATTGTTSIISTIAIIKFGTCSISANQAGDASFYAAAAQVSDSFTITKADQTITALNPAATTPFQVGGTLTMTATGGASTNPIVFASTTPTKCTVSGTNGATITAIATGTCTITANQAGDANIYNAAPQLSRNYTIVAAGALSPQAITGFASTPAGTLTYANGLTNTLSATAGVSGNPVTFSSAAATVCTVASPATNTGSTYASTVTILTAGTCTVRANQAANAVYAAAPQVSLNITIVKASQTITNFAPPAMPATLTLPVGGTLTLSATITANPSNLAITYATTTPTVCTVTNGSTATLTVVAAGTCTITANQAGNINYLAANQQTASITITTAAQIYYIHADHLGTPRTITKASDNSKVWEWKNEDAFGNNAPDENPTGGGTFSYNLRFPGQVYDAESATHYNYYRDYDSATGRYIQSDSIGLDGGLNTYSYGGSDPLRKIDPSGNSYLFFPNWDDEFDFSLLSPPKKVPGMWVCVAKCPMLPTNQTCPPADCSGTVTGIGTGSNLGQAKLNAKNSAQPKPGCQNKHCNYACRSPKGDPVFPSRN